MVENTVLVEEYNFSNNYVRTVLMSINTVKTLTLDRLKKPVTLLCVPLERLTQCNPWIS